MERLWTSARDLHMRGFSKLDEKYLQGHQWLVSSDVGLLLFS